MALPSSGAISLSQVNTELGLSSTTTISLGQSSVRTLFGVASGAISMSQGYGKANQFNLTISTNQTNANLRTLAVNAGWNQSSALVATIASGVYISSNSTGTPALTVSGSFPGGVSLTNNGYIIGMGGAGGAGGYVPSSNWDTQHTAGVAGSSGGGALSVSASITIANNGTIGGGGGGGGGGGSVAFIDIKDSVGAGGSGGGGGRSSNAANSSGGAGGTVAYGTMSVGNAGGAGTVSSAGNGGGQINKLQSSTGVWRNNGAGGTGGGWGSSGSAGAASNDPGGNKAGGSGGGAGYAVSGNGYISWAATGTRLGSIS